MQTLKILQTLKIMAQSAAAGLLLVGLALWAVLALGGDAITEFMYAPRELHVVATVLVGMGVLGLWTIFGAPAAPEEAPWGFSIITGALFADYVWHQRGAITQLWVTAALAAISALLIGGGLFGMWNFDRKRRADGGMSTIARSLLVVVAFLVVNAILYVVYHLLGIERGEWRYALGIGVMIAIVNGVWRLTAPKDRPPAPSK